MIKRILLAVLAALMIAAVQTPAFAADSESVEIVNDSNMSIAFLYVVPVDRDDWGQDYVGTEIMNLGDTRIVGYDPQYRYKIKIQLAGEGGETFTWYDVDLSDAWRLSMWYNGTDFELSKNACG